MDHRRRFSAFVASERDPRPTIVEALEFVREVLSTTTCDEHTRSKVAIVVEELLSNTLRHGGENRDISLALTLEDKGSMVELEVEDDASPFDPSRATDFTGPDPHTGGGIGLAIIRAWGEDISYNRRENRNILRLTLR